MKNDLIQASVLSICSGSFRFYLLISSSLSLMLSSKVPVGFTVPFGRPSASLEFLYSLSLSTRSVQDTVPEGVLSLCWCHERSEQSRSSQGYRACCGCYEILISLAYSQEVFCRDTKMSELKNLSHTDDKRITQRSQSNTNWRDKTSSLVISKRV